MIWHFLEVWALLAIMFAAGCALGAWLYGVIGAGRLATTQGIVADEVGDVIDRIKARLGVGPAWRRDHLASVERPAPVAVAETVVEEVRIEPTLEAEPVVVTHHEPARLARRETHALPPPLATEAEPEPTPATGDPEREAAVGHVAADGIVPKRPAGLTMPRGGVPDNLTRIRGIGTRNETLLNSLGIYHFGQIASWTPGEMRWIGQYLAFPERIERDDWIGQAIALASGTDTGFTKSAERRRQRRRLQQQAFAVRRAAIAAADTLPERKIVVDARTDAQPEPPEDAVPAGEVADAGDAEKDVDAGRPLSGEYADGDVAAPVGGDDDGDDEPEDTSADREKQAD
jgi:predicted flap endonuclease-1-like 5' DNA nuclease